ncbi:hypothetical protein [Halosolutus halophilus]|uniref:hypothetical protein n=1 Tax=Halosolutus halophilus TaxID=1552990 RepID=UPI0022350DEC|nr:hypothetical protein [Halosolutus halophilus]
MNRRWFLAAVGIALSTPLVGNLGVLSGDDEDDLEPFSPHQKGSVMVVPDAEASHHVEVTIAPLNSNGEEEAPTFEASATLTPGDGISANSIEFLPGMYRITVNANDETETYEWDVEESERRGVGKAWIRVDDDDLNIDVITTVS